MRTLDFWPFAPRRLVEPGQAFTVLVADDDVRVRAILEEFLGQRGCATFFAGDGTMALRCLIRSRDQSRAVGRIDAVIADAELPGRSGLDLLMMVRGHQWDLPVVLTAADLSDSVHAQLIRLGAAAVLTKPLILAQLERTLAKVAAGAARHEK